jgi:hypothetical protein
MSKRIFGLSAIAAMGLMLTIGGLVSSFLNRSIYSTPVHAMSSVPESANEIAGYRSWTKVNPQPVLMRAASAFDCAAPTTPIPHPPGVKNPHADKFITVYVNDLGRKAMLEMRNPAFPKGSVIVKEKLANQSSPEPELLTVMIKREKGFNPETGDWEYVVTDGSGTTVQARGKLDNCQACHLSRPGTDYIFRTYLPYAVRAQLK